MNPSHVFFILATVLVCSATRSADGGRPKVVRSALYANFQTTFQKTDRRVNGKEPNEGEPVTVNVASQDVIDAAKYVAETLSTKYESLHYELDRVHGGTSQQVAEGVLYKMTTGLIVTPTGGKNYKVKCTVSVLDQLSEAPRYSLEEYRCKRELSSA